MSSINSVKNYKYSIFSEKNKGIKKTVKKDEKKVCSNPHLYILLLLELPNPNYHEIQNSHQHLRDITLDDYDTKSELPIYIILGISDYTKVKTPERARITLPGELTTELTKLGWYIVSSGKEHDIKIIYS